MTRKYVGIIWGVIWMSFWNALGYAADPAGVMIYMEPPVGPLKIPQSMTYTAFQKTSVEYGNLTLANGRIVEIHNEGILGVFLFPPHVVAPEAVRDVANMEGKAAELTRRYPTARAALDQVMGKWKAALQAAAKRPVSSPEVDTTPPLGNLTANGVTYTKVSLSTVSGDNAKILHTDGVAEIPLAGLTQSQIAYLNSTSTSAHIDPDWKEKKGLAMEAEAKRAADEAATKRAAAETEARSAAVEAKRMAEEAGAKRPAPSAPGSSTTRSRAGDEKALSGESENLRDALLSYHWKWGDHNRPIEFHENGEMTGLKNATTWIITGPRAANLMRTGKTFAITFDENCDRFESVEKLFSGHRDRPFSADRGAAGAPPNSSPAAQGSASQPATVLSAKNSDVDWLVLSEATSDPYYYGSQSSARLSFTAQSYLPEIRDRGSAEQSAIAKTALATLGAEAAAAEQRANSGNSAFGQNLRFLEMLGTGTSIESHEMRSSDGKVAYQHEVTIDPGAFFAFGRAQLSSLEADIIARNEMKLQRYKLEELWLHSIKPAMEKRTASSREAEVIHIGAGRARDQAWLAFTNVSGKTLHNLSIRAVNNLNTGSTYMPVWFIPSLPAGRTVFTEPQPTSVEMQKPPTPGEKPTAPDRRLEIEYLCDEGHMPLRRIELPESLEIRNALANGFVYSGAKYADISGGMLVFNSVSGSGRSKSVQATLTEKGNPSSRVSLTGEWKEDFSKQDQYPGRLNILLRGPEPAGQKGFFNPATQFVFTWRDGNFSLRDPLTGIADPLAQIPWEPPQPTAVEEALAEALRVAVKLYPDLAIVGSKLNAEFIARFKTYRQDRPGYFHDTSWPIRLAEEAAQNLSAK